MSSHDDDVCPVRDELLGELCHADDQFMPDFVSTLAPDIRASLALFCYRRNHLRSIGLAIAASCDEADLMGREEVLADFSSRVRKNGLDEKLCHPGLADGRSRSRPAFSACLPLTPNRPWNPLRLCGRSP